MDGALERCALDALAIGIVVTGCDARVAYANAAAHTLLDRGATALVRRGGRIFATENAVKAELQAAIADVCDEDGADLGHYVLARSGESGEIGVAICVLPMRRVTPSSERQAMLILRPLEPDGHLEIAARRLFGLTRSEARIASAVASGVALQEAAAKNNVTLATVRSHMKRVYSKMGVSRQSQVAALLHGAHIPVHGALATNVCSSGSRRELASQTHRPD